MRNLRNTLIFAIVALLILASNVVSADEGPKNIIVMISDGCGYYHIEATSIYQHGKPDGAIYHQFRIQYGMSTYMSGGSYDPDKIWGSFNYVKNGSTDSAAAATTMATGVKTYSGAIGMDTSRQPIKNATERAKELGKATGIITSVEFAHATPAGFVAHNTSRNNYEQIAREMILDSKVDVIMGCGNPMFNNNGKPANSTYQYVGGNAVWDGLVAGAVDFDLNGDGTIDNSVEDIDEDGISDRWTLIQEASEFRDMMNGATPSRVIGIPQTHTTLQQKRSSSTFNTNVPTLEEMTKAALNVLDNDPDGLFLMIEGGAIDWASHDNSSMRMIEEEIDFNNSVEAVVDWVNLNSSWDETILIVTGDHETGYLTGPGSGPGANWEPIENKGAGQLPGMKWNSGSHTNSLLPFFAEGFGSDIFLYYADENDPVRGQYIDNAELGQALFRFMEIPFVAVQPKGKLPVTFGEIRQRALQTALLQNYPNPFNPETWIPFVLEETADVEIRIYSTAGALVRTLWLGERGPGEYLSRNQAAYWDGSNEAGEPVASGLYFYNIQTRDYSAIRKMIVVR